MFISRPRDKIIEVILGDDVSVSFRVSGMPKPTSNTHNICYTFIQGTF